MKIFEHVTEDLINLALKSDKDGNSKLLSFQVKPLQNKAENFLSIVVSVQVRYIKEGSEHEAFYVAKINGQKSEFFSETYNEIFVREIDALSIYFAGMNKQLEKIQLPPIKTPKIYASTKEKAKEVIIIEDLLSEGFKIYNIRKGMDMNHAQLVLKAIGRLHASSVLYEEHCAIYFPKYLKVAKLETSFPLFKMFDELFNEIAKTLMKFLKRFGPKYEKFIKWLEGDGRKLAKGFRKGYFPQKSFNTLIHGDCTANNMLFKYNEDNLPMDMRLVDFQFSCLASPASDLNAFFYSCLNKDFRVKERDNMLATYYEAFQEVFTSEGKMPPLSYQELEQEMKDKKYFGLAVTLLLSSSIIKENNKDISVTYSDPENLVELVEALKVTEEMLMKGGPLLERILTTLDEFTSDQLFY